MEEALDSHWRFFTAYGLLHHHLHLRECPPLHCLHIHPHWRYKLLSEVQDISLPVGYTLAGHSPGMQPIFRLRHRTSEQLRIKGIGPHCERQTFQWNVESAQCCAMELTGSMLPQARRLDRLNTGNCETSPLGAKCPSGFGCPYLFHSHVERGAKGATHSPLFSVGAFRQPSDPFLFIH